MELNPNHPVTALARDEELWHKIVAVVMLKYGAQEIDLFEDDVRRLSENSRGAVVLHVKKDRITLRIVSLHEGQRLAREAGGLPT